MSRHRGWRACTLALLLITGSLWGSGGALAEAPAGGGVEADREAGDEAGSTETVGTDGARPPDPADSEGALEAGADEGPGKADPCDPETDAEAWLDNVQRGIFRTVCSSARWFDGLFGDARFDDEAEETWGRLSLDTIHDEHDGFEARFRFRADVKFPNLENRVDAFFGREIEDDYVTGRDDTTEPPPELFRDAAEREWLVGLGYSPARGGGRSNRIDFRVGVKIRFPLEPFVQGRYLRHWFLSGDRLVRLRNTAFWRNQRGFGDTVTLDLEQILARPLLLRWTISGTLSEVTEGLDFYSGITLYQSLGGPRALAWTAYVDGETDRRQPVARFGLRTIYRQRLHRRWLFGQLIGGVSFPRDPGHDRKLSWELGVGAEIRYGRHPRDR